MTERPAKPSEEIWHLLRAFVLERIARKPGGHLVESSLGRIELELSLELTDGDGERGRFGEALGAAIDRLVDDAVQHAAAFRPGNAFCHRCASAACEHSRPPTSRHVFVSYTPTGQPRWADFAQHCLDVRHPEIDRLYEDPPALVTIASRAHELHEALVPAFRAGSFELLGQVVAGFFALPAPAEQGRAVVALTVQVAASRGSRGRTRLGLNLLGRAPDGGDLALLWDRGRGAPAWHGAVRWAQAALETLPPPARRIDGRRVEGILAGLARRLEHDHRARSRRTAHAQERHASGERPTRKAIDDARGAPPHALLVDERRETIVVLGDRGRTHFFTAGGRHVSSVRYTRDAIRRKVDLRLWRPASSVERRAFRERLPD